MDLARGYVDSAIKFVFPGKCFDELFVKFNFDFGSPIVKECGSTALSRMLGLAITLGSVLLFVPQILAILRAKSAEGISLCSQLLALLGAVSTAAYSYSKGFVFSQWGDSFFVSIQIVVIIMLILYYSPNSAYAFPFFSLCWAGFFAIQGGYIPMEVLSFLLKASIPIVFASKGIQIWSNHSARGTGQLSMVSSFLQLAGTLARVFTSVKETGDMTLIAGFAIAAALNAIIFSQFFVYGPPKRDKKKKTQ